MKVIVNQVAWIKVERHFTHELDIDPKEYALILEGEHEQYAHKRDCAEDQELNGAYYDYEEAGLQDRIESVEVEDLEAAE
jgi:hypothetical protein